MTERRQITFLTGTRADFGKLLPLIRKVVQTPSFDTEIVATGMHLLTSYGYTLDEIRRSGVERVFPIFNQDSSTSEKMDIVLANTIIQLSHYLNERRPDLFVIHGDRVETLAGAIAGALNNVLVAHVEGGEISGTVDEALRHAITKLCHVHFVANEDARRRMLQLGEIRESVFVIGSPEVDVMRSETLPDVMEAKAHYDIDFEDYAFFIYHPVTTELEQVEHNALQVVRALELTDDNFIVIRPNNDLGAEIINLQIQRLGRNARFKVVPSVRFEYYLTLLKHAKYIAGNSSSGVREAPVFGVPCVNIGTRQNNRSHGPGIFNVSEDTEAILELVRHLPARVEPSAVFGDGRAAERFSAALKEARIWTIPMQKTFIDRYTSSTEAAE